MIKEKNHVKTSDDACSFKIQNIPHTNNTYSHILPITGNTFHGTLHNISMNTESVVMIIYNSRNGKLFMGDVLASIKRLTDIGNLPYDWNGYGAKPFSCELIDKCQSIVNTLSHQPEIYPTGRSSIQFQYELEDNSYLEFEIFEDKTLSLYVPKRIYKDATEKEIIDSEEEYIKKMVDDFYGDSSTEK